MQGRKEVVCLPFEYGQASSWKHRLNGCRTSVPISRGRAERIALSKGSIRPQGIPLSYRFRILNRNNTHTSSVYKTVKTQTFIPFSVVRLKQQMSLASLHCTVTAMSTMYYRIRGKRGGETPPVRCRVFRYNFRFEKEIPTPKNEFWSKVSQRRGPFAIPPQRH